MHFSYRLSPAAAASARIACSSCAISSLNQRTISTKLGIRDPLVYRNSTLVCTRPPKLILPRISQCTDYDIEQVLRNSQ